MPEVAEADNAFLNRLLFVVIPETVPEEEQDPDLLGTLAGERAAILNWMLDSLDRLMRNTRFTAERDYDDKETIILEHGDATDRFAQAALEVTGDDDDLVHKGDLYELFIRFNDYIGHDPGVQQTFTSGLKATDGISDGQSRAVGRDDSRERVFKGIRVSEETVRELQADQPRYRYSDGETSEASEQDRLG